MCSKLLESLNSSVYTKYKQVEYRMALSIKNMEVEQLARELARRRRVSVTEAIRQSLEREVARERLVPRDETSDLFQRLMAISDRAGKIPEREERDDGRRDPRLRRVRNPDEMIIDSSALVAILRPSQATNGSCGRSHRPKDDCWHRQPFLKRRWCLQVAGKMKFWGVSTTS